MQLTFEKEIPIFFSADYNYLPFLTVAVQSIKANANKNNLYKIYILSEDLGSFQHQKLKDLESENIKVNICDVSNKVLPYKNDLKVSLRDYYTVSIFYRMFIASLFPNYDKAIYIDSDVVLLTDIANLFDINLQDNILGVCQDQVVSVNAVFKTYVENALGIMQKNYFNSGVLLLNLKEFRAQRIEEKFLYLLQKYNLESVAPDQDYLNVLCKDKVYYLDAGWDKMPTADTTFNGELKLIHYNMYNKPWYYCGVPYEEYFWENAKLTPYYKDLLAMREKYSEIEKQKDANSSTVLLSNCIRISKNELTFKTVLEKEKL